MPGPLSRDDDEDSSPLIQDLDPADHVPCSTRDMTTSGHEDPTLTHSLGASALGSETFNSENANFTDSDRKMTPASLPQSAKLTGSTGRLQKEQYPEGRSTQERYHSASRKFLFSQENVPINQSATSTIQDYGNDGSSIGLVKRKSYSVGSGINDFRDRPTLASITKKET